MYFTFKNAVIRHINLYKVRYFFLILCLLIGVIAGIVFVGAVPENQSSELNQFINSFCQQVLDQQISQTNVLKASIISNLRILCLIWVCGLYFILSPAVYGILGIKGFGIGFTIGFLTFHFGFKGFMLSMVSILPQAVFSLPALFFLALIAIRYAYEKRKRKKGGGASSKIDETKELKRFTYLFLFGSFILLVSSVIDAFIIPVFVKGICGLFLQ